MAGHYITCSSAVTPWGLPRDPLKWVILAVPTWNLRLTEVTQLWDIANNCPRPDLTQVHLICGSSVARALFPIGPSSVILGPINLIFFSVNQQSCSAGH